MIFYKAKHTQLGGQLTDMPNYIYRLSFGISVVNAKNCLVGRRFSVKESINGWSEGLMNILDILIGLPDLGTKNLELKLHEERAKYLVCELKCPLEDTLGQYIDFIRRMIIKNSTEKGRIEEEKAPMLNFIFQTPQVRQQRTHVQ